MKTFLALVFLSVSSFSAPGIDPPHLDLNADRLSEKWGECKDVALTGVSHCEKAMLYEMHLKENIHKGVSFGEFVPLVDSWTSALAAAEAESAHFEGINFNTDTSLLNAIQSNISSSSMGYEMTSKFNRLIQSIDAYGDLMDVITRQTILEHRIETIITQVLFEEAMAEEIRDFKASR